MVTREVSLKVFAKGQVVLNNTKRSVIGPGARFLAAHPQRDFSLADLVGHCEARRQRGTPGLCVKRARTLPHCDICLNQYHGYFELYPEWNALC